MSMIVPISMILAGGLCYAAGFGAWMLLRRRLNRWRTLTMAAAILLVFPFAWYGVIIGACKGTTQTGINANPAQANRFLARFDVPDQARAVNYRHSTFGSTPDIADFEISAGGFLAWAKANGWDTEKFPATENAEVSLQVWATPARAYFDDTVDMIAVTSGYRYTTDTQHRPGLLVIYDLETERAYIRHARF